jgi:hypothetical protein
MADPSGSHVIHAGFFGHGDEYLNIPYFELKQCLFNKIIWGI